MRMLVVFAVDAEFAPWRSRRRFRRRTFRTPAYGSASVYEATFANIDVQVLLGGIALRKGVHALPMLLEQRPDICLVCGLAGALSPSLRLEEIVVARRAAVATGDLEQSFDFRLVEIAVQLGATVVEVSLTTDRILGTTQSKLGAASHGDIVEMESFKILKQASEKWIPTVQIRAISDLANQDLPLDFDKCTNKRGEISLFRVLLEILGHPFRLFDLVAFGKTSKNASVKLADFLDRYTAALASYYTAPIRQEQVAAR